MHLVPGSVEHGAIAAVAEKRVVAVAADEEDEVEVAGIERQEIDSVAVVDSSPSKATGAVDSLAYVVGYLHAVVGIVRDPADYYSIAVEDPADEVIDYGSLIADLSLHHWVGSFYYYYLLRLRLVTFDHHRLVPRTTPVDYGRPNWDLRERDLGGHFRGDCSSGDP